MTTETYLTIALIIEAVVLGWIILREQGKRQGLEERLRCERDNRVLSTNSIIDRVHNVEMQLKALPTKLGYTWDEGTQGKWVKK